MELLSSGLCIETNKQFSIITAEICREPKVFSHDTISLYTKKEEKNRITRKLNSTTKLEMRKNRVTFSAFSLYMFYESTRRFNIASTMYKRHSFELFSIISLETCALFGLCAVEYKKC